MIGQKENGGMNRAVFPKLYRARLPLCSVGSLPIAIDSLGDHLVTFFVKVTVTWSPTFKSFNRESLLLNTCVLINPTENLSQAKPP